MGSDSFDKSDAERGVEQSDAADAVREPGERRHADDVSAEPDGPVFTAPGADAAETEVVSVAKSGGPAGATAAAPGAEPGAAQHLAPWERQPGAGAAQSPDPWRQPAGAFGGVGAAPPPPTGAWPGQGLPSYPGTPGDAAYGLGPQNQSTQYPAGAFAGASYPAVAAPAQMWMPPGRYLTQSTWRKRWKLPVIVGSSVVGVLMAVITIFAVVFGGITASVFTARGVVVVNCQTGTAQDGLIKAGSEVRIWAEDGALEGTTRLDAQKSAKSSTGGNVCYLPFEAKRVSTGQTGFNVRVGSYTQFATASALRSGVVLRPTA